jgi:N-acetylglucosamine kinase-like BadF-type ATPase
MASLSAAYRGEDGILVIAGGVSQSLGVKGGGYAKAGGWDSKFGGEGTSTRIAAEGLRASAKWADGRGNKTAMLRDFCMTLDCSPDYLDVQIHDEHVDFSELCGVVFRCAEAGDTEAVRIVTTEARELVLMSKAVANKLDMTRPRIALVGCCFAFPFYLDVFLKCARVEFPDAEIRVSDDTMAEGAAILAKMEASVVASPVAEDGSLPPSRTAGTI